MIIKHGHINYTLYETAKNLIGPPHMAPSPNDWANYQIIHRSAIEIRTAYVKAILSDRAAQIVDC